MRAVVEFMTKNFWGSLVPSHRMLTTIWAIRATDSSVGGKSIPALVTWSKVKRQRRLGIVLGFGRVWGYSVGLGV